MPKSFAYVTLLTTDSYIPGALVLGHSLKDTKTTYPLICLVTPESVSPVSIQYLKQVYDEVIFVSTLRSADAENLQLLGRKDLDITFTKIHVWNPDTIKYERVVFMDSDVLVLRNVDELFEYLNDENGGQEYDFAAAPDSGWPDCFNSGVFVTKPSKEHYDDLLVLAQEVGSFDGGDQGLLNTYFSSWSGHRSQVSTKSGKFPMARRIPFIYNVTPSAVYSYLPAFKQFANEIAILHFIGELKPWRCDRFSDGKVCPKGDMPAQTVELIQRWWDLFDAKEIDKVLGIIASEAGFVSGWNLRQLYGPVSPTFQKPLSLPSGTVPEFATYRVGWDSKELPPEGLDENAPIIRPPQQGSSSQEGGNNEKKEEKKGFAARFFGKK